MQVSAVARLLPCPALPRLPLSIALCVIASLGRWPLPSRACLITSHSCPRGDRRRELGPSIAIGLTICHPRPFFITPTTLCPVSAWTRRAPVGCYSANHSRFSSAVEPARWALHITSKSVGCRPPDSHPPRRDHHRQATLWLDLGWCLLTSSSAPSVTRCLTRGVELPIYHYTRAVHGSQP